MSTSLNAAAVADATVAAGCRAEWTGIRWVSRRLLESVRDKDWQSAAELQAQRDRMVRNFFQSPVSGLEAEFVRQGILEILESDKECMDLIGEEKRTAGAKIYNLQSGRRARKAYAETRNGV